MMKVKSAFLTLTLLAILSQAAIASNITRKFNNIPEAKKDFNNAAAAKPIRVEHPVPQLKPLGPPGGAPPVRPVEVFYDRPVGHFQLQMK